MPPVFICETDDDRTTLSENSVGFYMAARKAGVSAELHIFRTGGHGYGCGDDFAQTGEWKVLFTKWIKSIIDFIKLGAGIIIVSVFFIILLVFHLVDMTINRDKYRV